MYFFFLLYYLKDEEQKNGGILNGLLPMCLFIRHFHGIFITRKNMGRRRDNFKNKNTIFKFLLTFLMSQFFFQSVLQEQFLSKKKLSNFIISPIDINDHLINASTPRIMGSLHANISLTICDI